MCIFAFSLLLFYFLQVSKSENVVSYKSCEDGNSVLNLRMIPCNSEMIDDWPTCVVKRGEEVQVKAFFVSAVSSSHPMIVSTAIKNGMELVLPDTGSDPCDGSIVPGCPLIKEKVYGFNRYFETPEDFTSGLVEIKFGLLDPNTGKLAVCARVPVYIEKSFKDHFSTKYAKVLS